MRDRVESVGGTPASSTPSPGGAPGCVPRIPSRRARGRRGGWLRCVPGWPGSWSASTVVLVAADVVVSAQAVSLLSEAAVAVHGFPFVDGAVLGCALMGALIISRYERHPIGWLLARRHHWRVLAAAEAYAYWVRESDGPGPEALGGIAGWVSALLGGQLAIAGLALMFLLAPDGHFLSRRWRYAALVPAVGGAAVPGRDPVLDPTDVRPDEPGTTSSVRCAWSCCSVGFLLISLGLVASVVSMVRAAAGSSGEQRQQLRLIALSAALVAVGLVVLFVGAGGQRRAADLAAGAPAVRRPTSCCRSCSRSRCCATGSTTST